MRALFNPIVRNEAGTISATNASINYSPDNIKHPFIKLRVQAVANSQVLTIPFTADQSADCLFYGIHNLSSLVAVFKNSGGGTEGTVTIAAPGTDNVNVEYFTQIDNIRSIELTITTASTYVKLGGFDCGVFYQMPYFTPSYPMNTIDNSLSSFSLGGQSSADDIEKLRGYNFTFDGLTHDEALAIIAQYNLNGKRPMYIDILEGTDTGYDPIYCVVSAPLNQQRTSQTYTSNIEIQEAF